MQIIDTYNILILYVRQIMEQVDAQCVRNKNYSGSLEKCLKPINTVHEKFTEQVSYVRNYVCLRFLKYLFLVFKTT